MEEAFLDYLLTRPSVVALVARQINWTVRPQGADLPGIALHLVNGIPAVAMSGPVNHEASLVQVDCWGRTGLEALTVVRTVITVTHGLSFDHGGVSFQGLFVEGRRADADLDGDVKFYRSSLDLRVWHATL